MSGTTDYERLAKWWDELVRLADEADWRHREIFFNDGGEVHRGKCLALLEALRSIEREVVAAGDEGREVLRQIQALSRYVDALASYPGKEEAEKPGPTGQELLDAAFERYMEGIDLAESLDSPANQAQERRLEREVASVHELHGWGVFAPEHIHRALSYSIWSVRFECMRGLADAQGHVWSAVKDIRKDVRFLTDQEQRKAKRRSKAAKDNPRRGADDQMDAVKWDRFLRGLDKELKAEKRKPSKSMRCQQAVIENAIERHNEFSNSKITIGWEAVKKKLQRWRCPK